MQKCDGFAFGAKARLVVDDANAGGAAALECSREVVHDKADVVNTGSTLGDELADR